MVLVCRLVLFLPRGARGVARKGGPYRDPKVCVLPSASVICFSCRALRPSPTGERHHGSSGRAYASRFLRLTAHLEDFFEKSSVRGGGDPLAGNAHLGRMLFEQAQGDPPQHGEVLGPASALQPTGILAEVDVHVPV